MNELIFQTKDDKQLVYVPEKCIGCGTCILTCAKDALVIGSVGAVARGLVDQDFLESVPDTCIVCSMCAKVCPTGALEIRVAGEPVKDETYLCGAIKPTTVSDDCMHCGLCEEVCPLRGGLQTTAAQESRVRLQSSRIVAFTVAGARRSARSVQSLSRNPLQASGRWTKISARHASLAWTSAHVMRYSLATGDQARGSRRSPNARMYVSIVVRVQSPVRQMP